MGPRDNIEGNVLKVEQGKLKYLDPATGIWRDMVYMDDISNAVPVWAGVCTSTSVGRASNEDIVAGALMARAMAEVEKIQKDNKEKEEKMSKDSLRIEGRFSTMEIKNSIAIDHVIFSGPATIVFWDDGTKTVVKCMDGDEYAYDTGIAMATLKKIFGPTYSTYRNCVRKIVKKHVEETGIEDEMASDCEKGTEERIEDNIEYFDRSDIYPDCTVQVLTNTETGETSVGWWKNNGKIQVEE